MKILIVDDSVTMRQILANTLQRIGHSPIVQAVDGREALSRFDASIELVITDWNMPNMTGIEFTSALRARPDGKDVPILMVTTRSVREDILAAVKAGVNNYILKPFTPRLLEEKIAQARAATAGPAS